MMLEMDPIWSQLIGYKSRDSVERAYKQRHNRKPSSLTCAFVFVGTPSVIASLWSVEDEATSLLMERFYTHLKDGMSKAEALRQARLKVRDYEDSNGNYPYQNSYYLAAFVLSGDGGCGGQA